MVEPSRASEKINRAAQDLFPLIEAGEKDKVLAKISAFQDSEPGARYTLARLLVSTGQAQRNRAILECGTEAFERLKTKSAPPADPMLYYDVANGYIELYSIAVQDEHANVFDCEDSARKALRYAERGPQGNTWALTNLGNLYDEVGRPVEALRAYGRALAIDPDFGMALGNQAVTIQALAPVTRYPVTHLIQAHQLYQQALANPDSIAIAGLDGSPDSFRAADDAIVRYLTETGQAVRLDQDLRHEARDDSALSGFVRFYTRFCLEQDLYLNLHMADRAAQASVGDEIVPHLVTSSEDGNQEQRVSDIMFRLNEIIESYSTARMALVQSQYVSDDFSALSEQTTLVNLLDYSASNIYVGHLKMAYKEAFSALDNIAILLNHYIGLGIPEEKCYYRTVWYEHGPGGTPVDPRVVSAKVKEQGWRLFGLYLLHHEVGGKYADIRNILTHRYLRVFRTVKGPQHTYLFEDLTTITTEVLYKVKCAIIYMSLFIHSKEQSAQGEAPTVSIALNTNQHLDLWH